jgi:hypothetical protein
MLQALWSLEVLLADEAVPAGVVIFHLRRVFGDYFQAGRLFGGDSHCHYVGDYQIENLGGRADAVRPKRGAQGHVHRHPRGEPGARRPHPRCRRRWRRKQSHQATPDTAGRARLTALA